VRIRQKQVSSATSLPSHGLFLPPEFSLDELGLTSLAPIAVITGEWIIQRTAAPRTHFLFFAKLKAAPILQRWQVNTPSAHLENKVGI